MDPLDAVKLSALMRCTSGRPEIAIGLLDGPVARDHPDLADATIREIPGKGTSTCRSPKSAACAHGTFVAGILSARRGSIAPAICPACTLIVRPIFAESTNGNGDLPSATPEELAAALIDAVNAGVRVINLSAAFVGPSARGERQLKEAFDYATSRGVISVVAAGNQKQVGSSGITRHFAVIPVVSCRLQGRPTDESNLGGSIGRRGLSAPGDKITSLGANGQPLTFGGTSAAAPFVTGTVALLWSAFPKATAAQVRFAVTRASRSPRRAIVPPMLDAWNAYSLMNQSARGS